MRETGRMSMVAVVLSTEAILTTFLADRFFWGGEGQANFVSSPYIGSS